MGAGQKLPLERRGADDGQRLRQGRDRQDRARPGQLGFKLYATRGTADWLTQVGLPAEVVNKVAEGSPLTVDLIARARSVW